MNGPIDKETDEKVVKQCMEALAVTRAYVRKRAPYVSSILYGLVPYLVTGLGTLGVTDKMVCIIDAKWFLSLDLDTRGGVIFHEINHVLRDLKRMDRFPDADLANIAFDLPINHDERTAGWKLPDWAKYPETYNLPPGLTGEEYYRLLEKQQKKQPKGGTKGKPSKGKGKGGSGQSNGHGVCGGHCGSIAGRAIDADLEKKANEEVGRSKSDKERIQRQAIREIQDAAKRGGAGRGSMPASFQEWLEFSPDDKPLVPWKSILSRVLRRTTGRIQAGRQDFSLARPSKRSMTRGIPRPGLIDRKITLVFIEDSSGSMGKKQLKHVRLEIAGIMKQMGIDEAWFMDADAAVAAPPRRVRMKDIMSIPVHGGGGTNFIPALEMAMSLKPKPDGIVYLTDGDGTAPEYPPRGVEVIWCIVPSKWQRKPADWGHLIVCTDDEEIRKKAGI